MINRYSDVRPYEERKYWYFTTHGVGPGTIPKDLNVLDVQEGQNDKGTWGFYVLLDGVLNTSELREYDMRELAPIKNSTNITCSSSLNSILSDLEKGCQDWLESRGYEESFSDDYIDIEVSVEGRPRRGRVEVRVELGYDDMFDFITHLDPIIQKYDPEAYFDMDEPGICSAYIDANLLLA